MPIKGGYIHGYLDEIRCADALLIVNDTTNGVEGFIGANALMEAAFGYGRGLPVVLLLQPGLKPCSLEALAIM